MPNEDLRKFYPEGYRPLPLPAVPAPEPEMLEDEGEEQPQEGGSKWEWIGSPSRPEAKKYKDGISDLFEVDTADDTADLVSVDLEEDIIDADEDGSLDSLTEVSEEDIMGDEETGQVPLDYKPDLDAFNGQNQKPKYRIAPRARRPARYIPPTGMRGMR